MLKVKQNLHITGLHKLYLPVTNAKATAAWFRRHFGLISVGSESNSETLRLEEGALLTLVEGGKLNAYDAITIQIKAHDALKAYHALDLTEVKASEPEKFHQYTDFNVRDPDGSVLGVISDPAWPNTPNNYFKLDGVFITVKDIERAFAWYNDILGAGVEYEFTFATETLSEARHICYLGIPVSMVESVNGEYNYRICDYLTEDISADYAYLRGKNVKVTELRKTDGGTRFEFYDLDGREFGLVQLAG